MASPLNAKMPMQYQQCKISKENACKRMLDNV